MPKSIIVGVVLGVGICIGVVIGSFWQDYLPWTAWDEVGSGGLGSALLNSPKDLPLERYTFPNLQQSSFEPAQFELGTELRSETDFSAHTITISTLDKSMSGQLNLPTEITPATPVIVMLRGYVSPEIYTTGLGTRNAAAEYARAGFITLAPDFFGYGESDPEPEDSWQARFEKPVIVAEILAGIQQNGAPTLEQPHKSEKIGLWGHSNGGQIGLSTLEILQKPIPATFWAPVTAPFPYSILFFSIDHDDEGRGMRLWVNQLEALYDLEDFSITQHVGGLRGPLMIHHGTGDDAALNDWSERFAKLIEAENSTRVLRASTSSAELSNEPIEFTYHRYPGANHNLQPGWNTVVERDIQFFRRHLGM